MFRQRGPRRRRRIGGGRVTFRRLGGLLAGFAVDAAGGSPAVAVMLALDDRRLGIGEPQDRKARTLKCRDRKGAANAEDGPRWKAEMPYERRPQ